MIDKIKEMDKPLLLIIGLVITAVLTILIFLLMPEETSSDGTPVNLELPSDRNKTQNYESKLDAYNVNEPKNNSLDLDFEKGFFEEKKDTSSIYSEQDDPKIQELQKQIELMEQKNNAPSNVKSAPRSTQNYTANISKEQKEEAYRERLKKAKADRLKLSQDYSAAVIKSNISSTPETNVEFRVAVYRDQFVLPGDRITLILTQPMSYKGNLFPRNTFVYATVNIQQSRVLLNITNINSVPVNLIAKDIQDGNIGLYNQRAGELWREYQAESQTETVGNVSDDVSRQINIPLAGPAIRAFSNFFRKKKYSNTQKILLLDNHELLLINKTK